ncbi:homeobox-leucine zipper protein ATHB-15-like isoform X2 [Malus domestica]|uniref:homeobox-leucine zipper protein ATHB-15-like isoform X2 n=1 Tax=Malus domestica TaxID=3750 RepID=UPI003974EEDC
MLMLCSGMDENVLGSSAELFFAPIDVSFADDAPLLPSGFRIIPLDYGKGFHLKRKYFVRIHSTSLLRASWFCFKLATTTRRNESAGGL